MGLAPASYRVVIVDPDKGDLAGLIPTQAYTGKGETQASVTISDASVQGVDFGLVAPATIGDRVWNDADGNGADNGESGVPNVTVILKDANGVEVARTTTTRTVTTVSLAWFRAPTRSILRFLPVSMRRRPR